MSHKPRAPQYRLYLDETGDHGFGGLKSVENRYLGLVGCIFDMKDDYYRADEAMARLKKKYWPHPHPDNPVIFHREDILRGQDHFAILKDPKVRSNFDTDVLEMLGNAQYTIINVVLDKRVHKDKYDEPFDPYHYCLTVMLQRYCGWLKYFGAPGDVMAESRNTTADRKLKEEYTSIYENGTLYLQRERVRETLTTKEIKIKPKISNMPGLQYADLLARPLKEKLLFQSDIRKDRFLGTFNEKVYEVVENKLNRRYDTGRIIGYGEIFIQ